MKSATTDGFDSGDGDGGYGTCRKAALSVSLSASIQNCIKPVVCCNLLVQLICCSCVRAYSKEENQLMAGDVVGNSSAREMCHTLPLVFAICALYPFQWSLKGIHVALESFESKPHIA